METHDPAQLPYKEEMKIYNDEIASFHTDGFRSLNHFVMDHTQRLCAEVDELQSAIAASKDAQYIVFDNGFEDLNKEADGPSENIVFSGKRTYEAASAYKGKKVAVLNFANNHSIGGSPWSAGAQEECLCRESTLFPCLTAKTEEYYEHHKNLFREGRIDYYGNDDIIFTPGVVVFKSDESTPKLLKKEDWYSVDVITCAAPQLNYFSHREMSRYVGAMNMRIQKILQVAKKENVEALILGAFGCGAFCNPPEIVAKLFMASLRIYHFETVEFAIYDRNPGPDSNLSIFKKVFGR
ncbi:MAG: TIGR02452 family protein [Bacilli bacterium]|nr:TIGR02452 family protein [Bacilli bacterium]